MNSTHQAVGLEKEGFRFIRRNGSFNWTHPALVEPSDLDCTDMSDEQFEQAVAAAA